jgi:putative exporter of polyketide antibiotics
VLATAASRPQWATSHLTFGVLGPAVALMASGLAEGLVYGLVSGDVGRELPRVLAGALVQLPAVLVLSGIAMALFGLLPRAHGGELGDACGIRAADPARPADAAQPVDPGPFPIHPHP